MKIAGYFIAWLAVVAATFSYCMISEAAPTVPIPVIANSPGVPNVMNRPTKCYKQTTVTNHMRNHGYRIMFNWISNDGNLIKLVGVNPKADVIVVHVRGRELACVIDEIGPNVVPAKLFWDFYNLVPKTLGKKRIKKMGYDGFVFENMSF